MTAAARPNVGLDHSVAAVFTVIDEHRNVDEIIYVVRDSKGGSAVWIEDGTHQNVRTHGAWTSPDDAHKAMSAALEYCGWGPLRLTGELAAEALRAVDPLLHDMTGNLI